MTLCLENTYNDSMNMLLNTASASFLLLNLFIQTISAQDLPGGKWHQETMDAWKEFNSGKDVSPEALTAFLMNGFTPERLKFDELACNKGAANSCSLAGLSYSQKNDSRKASIFYMKGCEIAKNIENCMGATTAFLQLDNISQAKGAFVLSCNSNEVLCDYAWKGAPQYVKFRKLLEVTCSEGHTYSCSLLDKYKIKHGTPKGARTAAAKMTEDRNENEKRNKSWNGNYNNADCNSASECDAKAEAIFNGQNPGHLYVESLPYRAKACSLGKSGACLVVGSYEEDRNDKIQARRWYKKGCEVDPQASGLCALAEGKK